MYLTRGGSRLPAVSSASKRFRLVSLGLTVPAVVAFALATPERSSAADTTVVPTAESARTFSTDAGGWSSAVEREGLCVIPGVTCPAAAGTYVATGGTGGAGDGFLRSRMVTVANVLSAANVAWTSPSFAAPAETNSARLSLNVRSDFAGLVSINGSAGLQLQLVDTATPGSPVTIASPSLTAGSGFTRIDAAVPSGAVVAGHTYKLVVRAKLSSLVSLPAALTVDIDDVSLALTDLKPPASLTASVPASGALRVEGAIDPQGAATTVKVEYGTSASYGSTAGPVEVVPSASSYSVPLTGLAAGTTYHYRVVATNADGEATTSDATFVAPVPAGDAPPAVIGDASLRLRNVLYDAGADLLNATIEIRRNGVVVGTVVDVIPDGSVSLLLPDIDGDYDVRIIRTTTHGDTSVSVDVPALLDRTGPSSSLLDLQVAPTTSRDVVRQVSFALPVDAVSASVQVYTAGGTPVGSSTPVTGGTASVTLGAQDGTYYVKLTMKDAAGNTTTADSVNVRLDTSAPVAGAAPTVDGPVRQRTRSVTFDRALDSTFATVEVTSTDGTVLSSTPVPAGDEAIIELPTDDGAYKVRVRQRDLAGNESVTAVATAELDRTAPDAGAAPVVTGLVRVRERTVTFTRDGSTATATIEVVTALGTVVGTVAVPAGNTAPITLPAADGDYQVRVRLADAAGNESVTPVASVELDRTAPDATAPDVAGHESLRWRTVHIDRDSDTVMVTVEVWDPQGNLVYSVEVPTGDTVQVQLPDADGDYMVTVKEEDEDGNWDKSEATPIALKRSAQIDPDPTTDPTRTVTPATTATPSTGGGGAAGTGTATGPTAAAIALTTSCFGSKVAILTVHLKGGKVRVRGTSQSAPGTPVTFVTIGGVKVGATTVAADGSFGGSFKAPKAKVAKLARYRAVIGSARSNAVALRPANLLKRIGVKGTTVTIAGRVDLKRLGAKVRFIARGGRGISACAKGGKKLKVVGKVRMNPRTGAYRFAVRVPAGSGPVVVRTRAFGKVTAYSGFSIR